MRNPAHIVVIDPAMNVAEVECFNRMVLRSPLPLTYHLPAMRGVQSLRAEPMEAVRGIVILGSASSVHDRHPWQLELEAWLRPHLERGLPTLGICYGHQMLATMFGGRVDYVFPDKKKHVGFRQLTLTRAAGPWAAGMQGPVCVSHRETVVEVPRDFEVFATSAEIATDGLRHTQLPIFTFQPHPEATPEFLQGRNMAPPADGTLTFGHGLVDTFLAFAAGFEAQRGASAVG
jgi:GMP synthase (glutamine-hydrolysing)